MSVPATKCDWCHIPTVRSCTKCHSAFYCTQQHLINDWPNHKKFCKKLQTQSQIQQNLKSTIIAENRNLPPTSLQIQSQIQQNLKSTIVTENRNLPSTSQSSNWCFPSQPGSINTIDGSINTIDGSINTIDGSINTIDGSINTIDGSINTIDQSTSWFEIVNSQPTDWGNSSTLNTSNIVETIQNVNLSNELFNDSASNFASNIVPSVLNVGDSQTLHDEDKRAIANIVASLKAVEVTTNANRVETRPDFPPPNSMIGATFMQICGRVMNDMNEYGICVIDNFAGERLGTLVLDEVVSLYNRGVFEKGRLVQQGPFEAQENVRQDVATWLTGAEPGCQNIATLMTRLDSVVMTCCKIDSGIMSQYQLSRRTKAMVACYPGNGTHYKRHVDNAHQDGRCITCIYYLNKDWDIKKHGGVLRLFPTSHPNQPALIAPLFDRMILFWSDKRNPHEVLPSYGTRFALTLWYLDADERAAYYAKLGLTGQPQPIIPQFAK